MVIKNFQHWNVKFVGNLCKQNHRFIDPSKLVRSDGDKTFRHFIPAFSGKIPPHRKLIFTSFTSSPPRATDIDRWPLLWWRFFPLHRVFLSASLPGKSYPDGRAGRFSSFTNSWKRAKLWVHRRDCSGGGPTLAGERKSNKKKVQLYLSSIAARDTMETDVDRSPVGLRLAGSVNPLHKNVARLGNPFFFARCLMAHHGSYSNPMKSDPN